MRNRVLTLIKRLSLLATFMGFVACAADEICFTEYDTRVRIDFKRVIYPDTDSAFLENDTLIFFQITALDTDSVFVEVDTLSSTVLPVNTGADATTFLFDTDQGAHTLELQYQRTQRLISVDCGPEQIIDKLTVGQTSFDSLAVLQPEILEQLTTNVEIYH